MRRDALLSTVSFLGAFVWASIGTFLFMLQMAGLLLSGPPGGGIESMVSMLSVIVSPAVGCGAGFLAAGLGTRGMKVFAASLLAFNATLFLFVFLPSPQQLSGAKTFYMLSLILSPIAALVAGVWSARSTKDRTGRTFNHALRRGSGHIRFAVFWLVSTR
jgi:hypothetical protein